jgi:HD-GYP domain-containing protein (c-di-GMP phosphodiesterase class II)
MVTNVKMDDAGADSANSPGLAKDALAELVDIARAMTTERDVDQLLGLILAKSREVTGADAGSIYTVEKEHGRSVLRFKLTQNDSVDFGLHAFTIPVSEHSMAGTVALRRIVLNIADVYELPEDVTYRVDPTLDRKTGYVTRSMIAVPLISRRNDVIGVIQLINKKRHAARKLLTRADVEENVIPFDDRSRELVTLLAAQAGASLETAMLYGEIQALFDGFVHASVEAIESRDPTTSGHSRRVADLTIALARVVDSVAEGPFAHVHFDGDDLRELEYACLLHDFGKIGVREKVLVKAKKLYDEEKTVIRMRFDYVARTIEADVLARKVRILESGGSSRSMDALDAELAHRLEKLENSWKAIEAANEPTVLREGDFARIQTIASEPYVDLRGEIRTLLDPEDTECLLVDRGTLTPSELEEIRSHVMHSLRFLSRIPWGKSLQRLPFIAGAHHERPDGTGYPNRLRSDEIPVQSKLMSVADVYDALTASDRPYKKAVPVPRALDILARSAADGQLDSEAVRIFTQSAVWGRTA